MISNSTADYIPRVVVIKVEDRGHIRAQSGGKASRHGNLQNLYRGGGVDQVVKVLLYPSHFTKN